ncbi:deoxyribonuclease-4 [Dysgonomonas alginatilytica]|uniref:Probable endonuclease 4 n=1 Tax=Dysgonomonas alginatilytica TaxID=1605892 RepID=A0A2V3PQR7_9BACT|nr:deoxyribonuclease IV [Dysgonomonas alginatilytica]PXV66341.1 deoxyribonuclease-4 [Dysgonomonas alginatilytica]
MLNIGCHLSISKGYEAMGKDALSIGANTFQFFTRNPRGGSAKEIDPKDAEALALLMEENNFAPILAHAPYTLNLCSAEPKTRQFGREMMTDDLRRMEQLPCKLYNFHPGSHTSQTVDVAIGQIIEALNSIITPEQTTIVLLETMAGKGSEVGRTFEELKQILDGVTLQDKMGVCLDTCHVYDAGYDIVNDLEGVLAHFDAIIGLERLYAIHLNDSMNPKGSGKDRHATIGEGTIGSETMKRIINHPKLTHLPFYLETPNELDGHAKEIKLLKELYQTTDCATVKVI